MKKYLLILVLVGLTFTSCNRYPEGPAFTLLSKNARIANDWKVLEATENDVKVTENYKGWTWSFDKKGNYNVYDDNDSLVGPGTWVCSSGKKNITLAFKPIGLPSEVRTYLILKLKAKEMWITSVPESNPLYEYRLIQK